MNLELLRTFLEVNRTRHFGRAAEDLHLTQAAISARIREIEKNLGVTLFVRNWRDIQLTAEGHRLVPYADRLLSEWRKARQDVTAGNATSQLSIGGSLRLWDVALQNWFHSVKRAHPELAMIVEVHTPELLTQRILNGELDLAFMLEPAQVELLQIEPVADIALQLVSSHSGVTATEAVSDGFIMVDWGIAQGLQFRRLFPDAPQPRLRVAQAKIAHQHLLEIGGSAYLPLRMVAPELTSGQLFLVDNAEQIHMKAHAVYPIRSPKQALIDDVLEFFEYHFEFSE